MSDIRELIERLEAAEAGKAELDEAIYDAIGRPGDDDPQEYAFLHGDCPPEYTRSLDAALLLVPEGWQSVVRECAPHEQARGAFFANVMRFDQYNEGPTNPVRAATPALAICLAALKARLSEAQS